MASPLHLFAKGGVSDTLDSLPVFRVRIGAAVALTMYPTDSFGITTQAAVAASRSPLTLLQREGPPNRMAWLSLFARETIIYSDRGKPKPRTWTRAGVRLAQRIEALAQKGMGPLPHLQWKWPNPTEQQYQDICADLMEYFVYYAEQVEGIARGRKIQGTDLDRILEKLERVVSKEKRSLLFKS